MFQRFLNLNMIFILLLFTHMKMKKMLIGAFLGIFAVAGIAILPNYASAQTTAKVADYQDTNNRANPNAEANMMSDGNDQVLT